MTPTKKTTRKSTSSGRRPSGSRSASKRSVQPAPSASSFFLKVYRNPAGKVLFLVLGILLIVGLDILLALNNFDRFFILLGIELVLSILAGWVIFVLKDRMKDRN